MKDLNGVVIREGDVILFQEGLYQNDKWAVVAEPRGGFLLKRRIDQEVFEHAHLTEGMIESYRAVVIGVASGQPIGK